MFEQTGRKIFIGLVAGALLGAVAPVMAEEAATGVVVDSFGGAVMTHYGECVKAPAQPGDKLPPECGGKKEPEKDKVVEPGKEPVKEPITKEKILPLGENMVNFAFDKAVLTADGKKVLDNAATYMKKNNASIKVVTVQGHTDSVGTDAYNKKLGERRAKAVSDYLISQGVDKAKVKTESYGESKPVDTNKTKIGRAKNRRAEVHIMVVE